MRHSGTLLMVVGAALVLFYPALWVYGKISQMMLHHQWEQQVAKKAPGGAKAAQVLGRLVIPKIWVDQIVVQGVGESQLALGPGHFPSTALPGKGNCVIIGHLNTNGSPFQDLDKLSPGDTIAVQTDDHLIEYQVARSQIVSPSDLELLKQHGPSRLVLITCMPGAKLRYAVVCRQSKTVD